MIQATLATVPLPAVTSRVMAVARAVVRMTILVTAVARAVVRTTTLVTAVAQVASRFQNLRCSAFWG